jgi:hypothetical protein
LLDTLAFNVQSAFKFLSPVFIQNLDSCKAL